LEHRTPDPEEILEAISKVTAEDVNRVAQDVIGKQGVNLAVIGPFDDPARFEKLLA
jgi:predicted Zn-dependent peptidase